MLKQTEFIQALEATAECTLTKFAEGELDITVPGYEQNRQHRIIGLNLSSCKLKKIPEILEQLPHHKQLKRIYLNDNLLTEFSELLFYFPALEVISLANNKISTLPALEKLSDSCHYLDVSNNQITILNQSHIKTALPWQMKEAEQGLILKNNPLSFPSPGVILKGMHEVEVFLSQNTEIQEEKIKKRATVKDSNKPEKSAKEVKTTQVAMTQMEEKPKKTIISKNPSEKPSSQAAIMNTRLLLIGDFEVVAALVDKDPVIKISTNKQYRDIKAIITTQTTPLHLHIGEYLSLPIEDFNLLQEKSNYLIILSIKQFEKQFARQYNAIVHYHPEANIMVLLTEVTNTQSLKKQLDSYSQVKQYMTLKQKKIATYNTTWAKQLTDFLVTHSINHSSLSNAEQSCLQAIQSYSKPYLDYASFYQLCQTHNIKNINAFQQTVQMMGIIWVEIVTPWLILDPLWLIDHIDHIKNSKPLQKSILSDSEYFMACQVQGLSFEDSFLLKMALLQQQQLCLLSPKQYFLPFKLPDKTPSLDFSPKASATYKVVANQIISSIVIELQQWFYTQDSNTRIWKKGCYISAKHHPFALLIQQTAEDTLEIKTEIAHAQALSVLAPMLVQKFAAQYHIALLKEDLPTIPKIPQHEKSIEKTVSNMSSLHEKLNRILDLLENQESFGLQRLQQSFQDLHLYTRQLQIILEHTSDIPKELIIKAKELETSLSLSSHEVYIPEVNVSRDIKDPGEKMDSIIHNLKRQERQGFAQLKGDILDLTYNLKNMLNTLSRG